jgi:hypothetical protein
MEGSSDGAKSIAMNQSLFVVITHFYTVRSTLLYIDKYGGLLFPCWVTAKRKKSYTDKTIFLDYVENV